MATYTAAEILRALDLAARRSAFPMLDNEQYDMLAGARLVGFRDETRWALVIELLLVMYASEGIVSDVFAFGSSGGRAGRGEREREGLIERRVPAELVDDDPRKGSAVVMLRGERISVQGLEREARLEQLLFRLLPAHREALLARDEELARHVAPGLALVIQLDDWHHPDLAAGELPSGNATFRQLAEVLQSGEASRYQPSERPNTSWRHWTPHLAELLGLTEAAQIADLLALLEGAPDPAGPSPRQLQAALRLGRLREPRALPFLCALLDRDDPAAATVHLQAATALGELGDPRSAEPLAAALERCCRDRQHLPEVPRWMARLLASGGDDQLVARIAAALGRIGGPVAVGALEQALENRSEPVRCAAVAGLHLLADVTLAIPALVRALADSSLVVQASALEALAGAADPQVIEPLLPLVTHQRAEWRRLALDALARFRTDDRVAHAVESAQSDDDPGVAARAREIAARG
jgi:HEAT repeat protein